MNCFFSLHPFSFNLSQRMDPLIVVSSPEDVERFKSPSRRGAAHSEYEDSFAWRGLVPLPSGLEGASPEVHHVDPSHFKTSNQENYGAPGEDAYQREQTPSRAQPDVRHVDPSHFKTSNQENYGAPGEDAYERKKTPSRSHKSPSVSHADPSHFQSSAARDFKAFSPSEYALHIPKRSTVSVASKPSPLPKFSSGKGPSGKSTSHSDYPAHPIVPHLTPARSSQRGGDFGIGGIRSEYKGAFTPKTSPPRSRPSGSRVGCVHHVDASHFLTTKEINFKAPPASAYNHVTPSRARVSSVSHAPPSHFVSTSQASYGMGIPK